MLIRVIPWKILLRWLAASRGFVDPLALLAQFNRFAKPAELVAPTELLRAGARLHARGLINSQAIQHNLDWVWPYWVAQQYNPLSPSFVPRAFALTHINLTHRNWTAIGVPGYEAMPIVDPRGMITPLYDAWSLDFWLIDHRGHPLLPSRLESVEQHLLPREGLSIQTMSREQDRRLQVDAWVSITAGIPWCRMVVDGELPEGGLVVVALRPFNPEGVSFIDRIELVEGESEWRVNGHGRVVFGDPPDAHLFSHYHGGDVLGRIVERHSLGQRGTIRCRVGMATAAAVFEVEPHQARTVHLHVPLPLAPNDPRPTAHPPRSATARWHDALQDACRIEIPDTRMRFLAETGLRTLALHAPDDVYAGPYTYKRFWFRDAVLIGNAMLTMNMVARAQDVLDAFPARQTTMGYFLSQEGEWDSNGQVLWLAARLLPLRTDDPAHHWSGPLRAAEEWIRRKRIPLHHHDPHAGLMPAGFSAEHLGPNDHYYWDDYWSIAGLLAGARLFERWGMRREAQRSRETATEMLTAVDQSLRRVEQRLGYPAIPAAPERRLDSAAVGSLAAAYPLRLYAPDDRRVLGTCEYLCANCLVNHALFHDISHAGINPYLTLHLAQALLRAGDRRYLALMESIAALASPTGQWPEAMHPQLGTGCMGDGQHVWAAAEWLMMLRSCFVLEEEQDDRLVLCAGIPARWLAPGTRLLFGPTRTSFGAITVRVESREKTVKVEWDAQWDTPRPTLEIRLPWASVRAEPDASAVTIAAESTPS